MVDDDTLLPESLPESLPEFPLPPVTVAVSECLVGGRVRYDGGHKRSELPHEALDNVLAYRSICPEVGIGLGVPRDKIRLVGEPDDPRAIGVADPAIDVTSRLRSFAAAQLPSLDDVDGYIFIRNSPSCGLFDVGVHAQDTPGRVTKAGRGIYAMSITQAREDLPVEEGGRLHDPVLRGNFVMRTFVHAHWRLVRHERLCATRLIAFHDLYETLVRAHSVAHYQNLGRSLSDLPQDVDEIAQRYIRGLMHALATPAPRSGHAGALSHLRGYLSDDVPSDARQALTESIDRYCHGNELLAGPVSLLEQQLREHGSAQALRQLLLHRDAILSHSDPCRHSEDIH